MGRFLTPSKVTLLVLALIYTKGVVPISGSTAVLAFLIKHILLANDSHSELEVEHDVLPITRFEENLSQIPSSRPGRSVWDLLVKKIWALDSAATIDDFITELYTMLAKTREQLLKERDSGEEILSTGYIQKTSPLGAFIRRCNLEYTRLQFQDSVAVWQEFVVYRWPTRQAYEKKNPPDNKHPLDVNLSSFDIDTSHPLTQIMFSQLVEETNLSSPNVSTYDVEKLMEFQVSEMQRLGSRLPEDMRLKLQEVSKRGATTPKLAHYLKFLDSWRAGDYSSAMDNLHRYFDYTMQSRDRTFYQYALLNLAILQADFACYDEAIPAMQEAISTARENRDTTCLNFCMSWLYHFGQSFPAQMSKMRDSGILGSEVEGLAFLKSRARDAEMWSLLGTSLLSEARLGTQHGDSLAIVFENIVKASHISVVKSVPNIMGPTLLMKSSVFSRMGQSQMAFSCAEMFLECYVKDATLEDILKCTCRLASLHCQRGRYADAQELMNNTSNDILRVLKYQNYWTFYNSLLKLRQVIYHRDFRAAERQIKQMKGQGAPDVELDFALSLSQVDLLMRKGDYELAFDQTEELAAKAEVEQHDVMLFAKLLCLKARLWALVGKPLKGFTVTMRAADIAYRARLLPSLWEAMGILANILIELHEFNAARDLLEAILPQVAECQDCHLAARTYLVLADVFMALAGATEAKSLLRKEHLSKAMEHIDASFEQFKFIEDLRGQLEMLTKKGRILHLRGDFVLANDTASQYLELKEKYAVMQL